MNRFPYYTRLSKQQKAVYRRSDAIVEVPLGIGGTDTSAVLEEIESGLRDDNRVSVRRSAAALVQLLCDDLDVPRVTLRVLARRPSDATSELHGLYEREDGKRPIVRVWMRTAAAERPVAFRTFVRVVLHELCHHLDYELFALADSMHTHGFFKRESSLVRQLLPPPPPGRDALDAQLALPGFDEG